MLPHRSLYALFQTTIGSTRRKLLLSVSRAGREFLQGHTHTGTGLLQTLSRTRATVLCLLQDRSSNPLSTHLYTDRVL